MSDQQIQQNSNSDYFIPSIYGLMWNKIKSTNNKKICMDAFFLPDTIFIEQSVIKWWHFTSYYEPYVMRKNQSQLLPEFIIEHMTKDVFPLQVCCYVIYIDFNKDTDILYKVNYLTPPQLRYFLNLLKQTDITCLIQKVAQKIPELLEEVTDPDQLTTTKLMEVVQKTRLKYNMIDELTDKKEVNQQNFKLMKHNKQFYGNNQFPNHYHLVKVDWVPDSCYQSGRKSKTEFSLYKFNPDIRCATYFADSLKAEQYALSETNTLFINQAFARLALHISMQLEKKPLVNKMTGYVQIFDTPPKRQKQQGDLPVFLFLTKLVINNQNYDENWGLKIKFFIRKQFKPPQFLDYQLCKNVVNSFSNTAFINTQSLVFQKIYKLAQQQTAYLIDNDENVTNEERLKILMKNLENDLISQDSEQRKRAYFFYQQIIEKMSLDEEYLQLQQQLQFNDNQNKKQCVKCKEYLATQQHQLKFLLFEPVFYFCEKIALLAENYKLLKMSDLYAFLHVVLFKDLSVMQYRDTIHEILKNYQNQNNLKNDIDQILKEDLPDVVLNKNNTQSFENLSMEQTDQLNNFSDISNQQQTANNSFQKQFTKNKQFTNGEFQQLFNNKLINMESTKRFFKVVMLIAQQSESEQLDLAEISRFYDGGVDDEFGGSVVPNKLLRECGVVQSSMEYQTFLQRLDRDEFINKTVYVCQKCFEQLKQLPTKMINKLKNKKKKDLIKTDQEIKDQIQQQLKKKEFKYERFQIQAKQENVH